MLLCFRRRDRSLGLLHLVGELTFLQAKGRLAFLDLRLNALGAVLVERAIGRQLAGFNLGDDLVFLDRVAFLDADRHHTPADLRRHFDVVRRDDAGQDQGRGREVDVVVRAVAERSDDDQGKEFLGHLRMKHTYKTPVSTLSTTLK